MPGSPYTVGQTVKLKVTATDPDTGQPVTPTSVVFKVWAPGASAAKLPTPMPGPAPNMSYSEVVIDRPGVWYWRVDTTSPNSAAERQFTVNSTQFPGG